MIFDEIILRQTWISVTNFVKRTLVQAYMKSIHIGDVYLTVEDTLL